MPQRVIHFDIVVPHPERVIDFYPKRMSFNGRTRKVIFGILESNSGAN